MIPESTDDDIFERLAGFLKDQGLVRPIKHFIERYIQYLNDIPDNFGVWVLHSFAGQPLSWPVVKWTEGENEAVAIFKLAPGKPIYSTLIHYGMKSEQSVAPIWSDSSLSWIVWDIEDLRDLLGAANQVLSVLYLGPEKAEAFFDPSRKECSDQE